MVKLELYNSLTRRQEVFQPRNPLNVGMYVCGPTVYDFAHLGNARPVVVFDVLYRLLQRHYPRVTYVRNITDVDDKIMARAKETGEPIDDITTRTTQAYHDDMAALNARSPTHEPRATAHIPQMQALIATLIAKGHAYTADGHVLFNVPSMADYGQLSRRNRDELIAGARVEVAPYKKDPADFVLWKPSAPDQPGWDSPWGYGRPGWHIECSAMAKEYLGETFDIHGGGLDLIFPHHENEIAQSCCAHNGAPLANIWMHNGFLSVNGEKMSKSLGNFFTVRELLQNHHGETIRLALLSAHYRQPLDFSEDGLRQAKSTLDRWYGALRQTGDVQTVAATAPQTFESALLDDLNMPQAIAALHEIANKLYTPISSHEQAQSRAELLACGHAIGLLHEDPEAWFRWQPAGQTGLSDAVIQTQIAARLAARKAKNFAEADRIRKELDAQGIALEDKPDGTTEWRRK
ncbi:MAG: cysteine--tRNA ligase [Alphaproteobacteria bacterium]